MELAEAMRTTGTCRYFRPDPVPDDVLRAAFDVARFGPQGGNRQPVRWIVVREAATRHALAELYLPPWKAYYNAIATGDVNVGALPRSVRDADYFAEHLASVPAIVVVCAEPAGLHPTDTELGRLSVVGGGSIYPTVQNLCLALRDHGVGTAVTTLLCIEEPKVSELLAIPDGFITACHIAVGVPGEAVPDGADAFPGRRDRVCRGVQQAAVRVTGSAARARKRSPGRPFPRTAAWQHRAPIGRATIGDQLRRHARTQPDKVAFVTYAPARAETTYGELDALANRYAHLLAARGVRRGDVVAMLARNGVPVVAAYYGALKLGAAFTVVNPMFRAHEVAQQLDHAEPKVVLADPALAPLVDGAPLLLGPDLDAELAAQPATEPDAEVDEHDVAMLLYTSGTTAMRKGVLIPHRNYLISTAPAWSQGLQTGPEDTWLFVMPFHTIAGLGSMTTLTLMGATLVLPATADPAATLPMLARARVTVIAQTPTFYLALAARPGFGIDTVGSVRRCMTYGGQVAPAVIEAWSAAAPTARWGTYWGQSELSQLGTVGWFGTLEDIPGGGDPSWIGKPVSHLEVRVVDEDGNDAELGELICRSPSVMLGYTVIRSARRPRSGRAGCTPATSCASTPRATCSSTTGSPT